MVSQSTDVRAVLEAVFPEEYRALGPTTVGDIVTGGDIEAPEEGRPFPLMEIAELLKDAAKFITACLAIYGAMHAAKSKQARPTEKDFEKEVQTVSYTHLT